MAFPHDESMGPSFELSNEFDAPTELEALSPGDNLVIGSTMGGNPPGDRDYFSFVVPTGSIVTEITLTSYSNMPIDEMGMDSYFALDSDLFPDPSGLMNGDESSFIVSALIDTDQVTAGTNLLTYGINTYGTNSGENTGGMGSLGPGTYYVWYQETMGDTDYTFKIVSQVNPVSLVIAATDASKMEGDAGNTPFTFTVARTGETSGVTTVDWAVMGNGGDPADASDFAGGMLPTGMVSFAANETSKVITVDVSGDTAFEPNENFTVTLSNPSAPATITTNTATGTIQNDDGISITAANANQAEGNTGYKNFTFDITRNTNINDFTLVSYAVSGSGIYPAIASDFGGFLPSGFVSFFAGQTSQSLNVQVRGDIANEFSETFTVTLTNASSGVPIAISTAIGTIQNDDMAPTFAIASTNASQTEGNAANKAFTFTVTRTGDTTGINNVDWSVAGLGLSPADITDFGGAFPSGTLNFTPGQASKVITVNVKGDTAIEFDESFTVTLSSATNGALIGVADAIGTVINDDIILGTNGNDLLNGSVGNDTISGLAGSDTASGLAGNDSLSGDAGNDFLTGGIGNDTLLGGSDNDTLTGVDPNNDFGQGEIDRLTGNSGSDRFILGDSSNTYYLGNGISDYALIVDFSSGDLIQTRTGDMLTIGGVLPTGVTGTALYLNNDLVAVVQGSVPTALSFVPV
jgi:hypothetical protein